MRITPAASVRAASVQYSNTDTLDAAVITTTETAFATGYTVPANSLIAGKAYRVFVGFQTTATGVPSMTLKLKLGGVVVWNGVSTTPSQTNAGHGLLFTIMGTVAAGASAAVDTNFVAAYWGGSAFNSSGTAQPVNLATNGDLALTVTCQFSAGTAGNTTTLRQLVVEAIG